MLRRERAVRALTERQAASWGVRIQGFANVGNHLHLLLRAPSRESLANFLRAIGGMIARLMQEDRTRTYRIDRVGGGATPSPAKEGIASGLATAAGLPRFWDTRPYSRLVAEGRDWLNVRSYIAVNEFEGRGASRDVARDVVERLREAEARDRSVPGFVGRQKVLF